jgi:DnaA family protein
MTSNAVTNTPKHLGSRQLTLGVTLNIQQQLSNFSFSGAPALAQTVDLLLLSEQADSVYVFGVQGVGKSHLLQGCVLKAQEMGQEAVYISCSELVQIPTHQASDCLAGLENNALVCVDDIDCLVADSHWAQAWFHLYNKLMQQGNHLVMSATSNPRTIDCSLNDLRSRLQLANVFQLNALDEVASGQLLQAKAKQKGLQLTDEQVAYIFSRSPRGLANLLVVLDLLDAASWHEKRRITIPFIKQVMAW